MVGYGARQHVRKNALQHLHQEITITRKHGSFTLEESLTELVQAGPGRSQGRADPRRAPRGAGAAAGRRNSRVTRGLALTRGPV